jgi:hypothetical protein
MGDSIRQWSRHPRWLPEWDDALRALRDPHPSALEVHRPPLLVSGSEAARRLEAQFPGVGFTKDMVVGRWKIIRRPNRRPSASIWTRQEAQHLCNLINQGNTAAQAAEILGRSANGVYRAMNKYTVVLGNARVLTRRGDQLPTNPQPSGVK